MFSNAFKLLTINTFDIKVDPSWLLIAALITWSLSQHYFPETYPGQPPEVYFSMALMAMLAFFASLLLHELAHSVVARRHKVKIKGITLFLFGGVAEMEQEPPSAAAELQVAIAGPLASIALAFGFWILAQAAAVIPLPGGVFEVLSYLAIVNLIVAIFNLVPAFPLDGGRVLRAYLWRQGGDILKATEVASKSGVFFAYVLMAFGLLGLFEGALISGLWEIFIGGFLLLAARQAYRDQLARVVFEGETVGHLMTLRPMVVSPDATLSYLVDWIMLPNHLSFVPVVENGVLLGHVDLPLVAGIDRENWGNTRVGDVFIGLDLDKALTADTPVDTMMQRIRETGQRKFMVTDDHRLLGVITLADIGHQLDLLQSAAAEHA